MTDAHARAECIRLEGEVARKDRIIADLRAKLEQAWREIADANRRAALSPR